MTPAEDSELPKRTQIIQDVDGTSLAFLFHTSYQLIMFLFLEEKSVLNKTVQLGILSSKPSS